MLDNAGAGRRPLQKETCEVNKIEELEQRCEQLEDRVATLEKALGAALARPAERQVMFQVPPMMPNPVRSDGTLDIRTMVEPWNWTGLNGF